MQSRSPNRFYPFLGANFFMLFSTSPDSAQTIRDGENMYGGRTPDRRRRERRERTNAMVREILQLVDSYSIMRKPSWDGVRVLLLLLPLMEGECLTLFLFVSVFDMII